MKALNKLNINPDNLLKNDDLKSLKGGHTCDYYCWVYIKGCATWGGPACADSAGEATSECTRIYSEQNPDDYTFCNCY